MEIQFSAVCANFVFAVFSEFCDVLMPIIMGDVRGINGAADLSVDAVRYVAQFAASTNYCDAQRDALRFVLAVANQIFVRSATVDEEHGKDGWPATVAGCLIHELPVHSEEERGVVYITPATRPHSRNS